jgi:hypothetical protein
MSQIFKRHLNQDKKVLKHFECAPKQIELYLNVNNV